MALTCSDAYMTDAMCMHCSLTAPFFCASHQSVQRCASRAVPHLFSQMSTAASGAAPPSSIALTPLPATAAAAQTKLPLAGSTTTTPVNPVDDETTQLEALPSEAVMVSNAPTSW